eukprot:1790168-Rhodomonas_salina.2
MPARSRLASRGADLNEDQVPRILVFGFSVFGQGADMSLMCWGVFTGLDEHEPRMSAVYEYRPKVLANTTLTSRP